MTDVDDAYGVIEAFLDGERVPPQALKDALADRGPRDHFVDLLQLRDAVGTMAPSSWHPAQRARGAAPRRRWVAAAAVLALSVAGGYIAGQRMMAAPHDQGTIRAVVSFETAPVAPPPTKVITLRPGVNWTETAGGR